MRILLTGGCGFIGSSLVRFLLRRDAATTIVDLDALTYSGRLANLEGLEDAGRHAFVRGDVRDSGLVASLVEDCDAVVHVAAESHVDRSIADARPFVETNVVGTQVLLDAARHAWSRRGVNGRFLLVSTDEVYGSLPLDDASRFTEESPLRPSSAYAASKAAADLLTLAAGRTHGMDVVVTRSSNNFGPRQFPEKVIPLFVTRLLTGGKAPLYGDGRNVRDWIHVEDHCEGIALALERGRSGEVYNLAASNERSNLELAHAILGILGKGPEWIERVADRKGHDLRYALDASKARRELGFEPTRSAWPEALESTVAWYRENESWWRSLVARG